MQSRIALYVFCGVWLELCVKWGEKMNITISGDAKEIAALVLQLQERQTSLVALIISICALIISISSAIFPGIVRVILLK